MKKPTTDVVQNPHDQFFRKALQEKQVAREFLQTHLPQDLCAAVDFEALRLQPRHQVNAIRHESIVDVLFKTRIANQEGYIYLLLEHQSSPDPLMAFRVLEYTVNAIRAHLKRHKTQQIPMIYPMVVYHGKPCRFTTDINDLVHAPRALVAQYFLKPFQLLDLNQMDDEVMKKNTWSGIMALTLKHIFAQDVLPFLKDMMPLLKKIERDDGRDFVGVVLQYVLERGDMDDESAFVELINHHISEDTGEAVMTIAEKLMLRGERRGERKGEIRGELQGKLEVARKMLEEGSNIAFVIKVTGLSLAQIKALQ